ncbi:MAG: hypothetical protein VX951_08955 [Planctomycetota bacterium]|nr:hypothetical protein [Planctomycetota bacterium]
MWHTKVSDHPGIALEKRIQGVVLHPAELVVQDTAAMLQQDMPTPGAPGPGDHLGPEHFPEGERVPAEPPPANPLNPLGKGRALGKVDREVASIVRVS